MALSVTHATQTVVADDPNYPVGSDEWNAAHSISGTLPVANGGTGAASATAAATALGLGTGDTPTFAGLVDTGARTFSGVISPAQITADQNDYAPTGFSTCAAMRLSTDASRSITGLAGGASGREVVLLNIGAQNIVLVNGSVASIAANRFGIGSDQTIPAGGGVLLRYDGTSSLWRMVHYGGTGTGDVVGPAAATDNAIARFDATTGKLIQNSGVAIDDTNNVTGISTLDIGNADTTLGRVSAGVVSVEGKQVADLTTENQPLAGGCTITEKDLGTVSSGTLTLDVGDCPHQKYTNNGAHTLAPGTTIGSILLVITNGASAGAITTSGWTKVVGSAFTTTNAHKFVCHASVTAAGSLLIVQAMQ